MIHYHAVLRRALQNAVKKDIIARNPADRIDKPKKNQFRANHCSEEEMPELFDVSIGDPLELAIKIGAYYGLHRSEVLGLKTKASVRTFPLLPVTVQKSILPRLSRLYLCGSDGQAAPAKLRDGTLRLPD